MDHEYRYPGHILSLHTCCKNAGWSVKRGDITCDVITARSLHSTQRKESGSKDTINAWRQSLVLYPASRKLAYCYSEVSRLASIPTTLFSKQTVPVS